jgi:hypothetical protein
MNMTSELIQEENRRVRMLRTAADLLVRILMTQPLTIADAERMIAGVRNLSLQLFPDRGEVFDLIYLPRFRRALRESGLTRGHVLIVAESAQNSSE